MSFIPVDVESATTERQPLDDSLTYEVMVYKFEEGKNSPNKHGIYYSAQYQVINPVEMKGKLIFHSYILAPQEILPEDDAATRAGKRDRAVDFWRMVKCFKVMDEIAEAGGFNTGFMNGKFGQVSIKNEEYEGNTSSKVKDYLF